MPLKRSTHWNCSDCGENQSSYGNKTCEKCHVLLTRDNTHFT
jgi:hypothetical protein